MNSVIARSNGKLRKRAKTAFIRMYRRSASKEGSVWTVKDNRRLCDLYFGYNQDRELGIGVIAGRTGRTYSAVETQISKLSKNLMGVTEDHFAREAVLEEEGYKIEVSGDYVHWTARMDRFLTNWLECLEERFKKKWNPTQKFRAPTIDEIASLLRRTAKAVEIRIQILAGRKNLYSYSFGL